MNLRPPGYEPGELPDCSTPRRWSGLYQGYDAAMPLLDWLCLLVFLVAIVASTAVAVVRGLRAWRTARAVSGAATSALDDVMRRAEEAEAKASRLEGKSAGLESAVKQLQDSLAELAVLRTAYANARSTLSFRMPTK